MTNRLTPVGSRGGAEAIFADMSVEVTHDDVFGDVAGGCREVAPAPEALAPIAFADVLELLLDLARGTPLGPTDEVADRDMRRYLDEHMDVIARQSAVDDGYAHLLADLPDDLAHPQTHITDEHLVPVLRRPDEVVAMMKSRVTTLAVAHSL